MSNKEESIQYKDWCIDIYKDRDNCPNPFLEYEAKVVGHNMIIEEEYKMRIHPTKKASFDIIFFKSYSKEKLTLYIQNILGYMNDTMYTIDCKTTDNAFTINNIHGKRNAYNLAKEIINSFY